jgi:hypothetical protein
MPYAPVPFNVCPCCGTEYGVDDHSRSHPQLRHDWVVAGTPWFSDVRKPRKEWSGARQLIDAGFGSDLVMTIGLATRTSYQDIYLPVRTFWSPAELNALPVPIGAATA